MIGHGRLEFGIGAGWASVEHEAYGIPFDKPAVRIAKLRERKFRGGSLNTAITSNSAYHLSRGEADIARRKNTHAIEFLLLIGTLYTIIHFFSASFVSNSLNTARERERKWWGRPNLNRNPLFKPVRGLIPPGPLSVDIEHLSYLAFNRRLREYLLEKEHTPRRVPSCLSHRVM